MENLRFSDLSDFGDMSTSGELRRIEENDISALLPKLC